MLGIVPYALHPFQRRSAALLLAGLSGALGLTALQTPAVSAHADRKLEGAKLFATRGCAHCHGANGEGTDSGPSLRDIQKRLNAKQIKHQIVFGGQAMPAFGDTLDHEQIDNLAVFLRSNQWPATSATPVPELEVRER